MLANSGYASLLPRFTLPEGKIVRGQNCPILEVMKCLLAEAKNFCYISSLLAIFIHWSAPSKPPKM